MKKVCIIGTGYVGLVSGTCLAEIGNKVVCVDKDRAKIDTLKKGDVPIYEPGIGPLIKKNVKAGRLSFSSNLREAVRFADVIFICVNTPPLPDGGADLSFVEACTREVAGYTRSYKLLVEKSTVPVQTGERIKKTLQQLNLTRGLLEIASNPEFLREGTAVKDFLNPDRIVLGVQSKKAENILRGLYAKIKAPVLVTDINSAELIKHASNSFLALKISYINAIAQLCERVGADVQLVSLGMGLDKRIGRSFLYPGIGYGGSCFPKDVSAFIKIADQNGYDFQILRAAQAVNSVQRLSVVRKLENLLWTLKSKKVALLGLAFKPETDDLRNAPSIDIIQNLLDSGAEVSAYDPVATDKMKLLFPDIRYGRDPYDTVKGADAVLFVTEWDIFRTLDLKKLKRAMTGNVVVDGRNIFDPVQMKKRGFIYQCIGRPVAND